MFYLALPMLGWVAIVLGPGHHSHAILAACAPAVAMLALGLLTKSLLAARVIADPGDVVI